MGARRVVLLFFQSINLRYERCFHALLMRISFRGIIKSFFSLALFLASIDCCCECGWVFRLKIPLGWLFPANTFTHRHNHNVYAHTKFYCTKLYISLRCTHTPLEYRRKRTLSHDYENLHAARFTLTCAFFSMFSVCFCRIGWRCCCYAMYACVSAASCRFILLFFGVVISTEKEIFFSFEPNRKFNFENYSYYVRHECRVVALCFRAGCIFASELWWLRTNTNARQNDILLTLRDNRRKIKLFCFERLSTMCLCLVWSVSLSSSFCCDVKYAHTINLAYTLLFFRSCRLLLLPSYCCYCVEICSSLLLVYTHCVSDRISFWCVCFASALCHTPFGPDEIFRRRCCYIAITRMDDKNIKRRKMHATWTKEVKKARRYLSLSACVVRRVYVSVGGHLTNDWTNEQNYARMKKCCCCFFFSDWIWWCCFLFWRLICVHTRVSMFCLFENFRFVSAQFWFHTRQTESNRKKPKFITFEEFSRSCLLAFFSLFIKIWWW